MFLRVFDCRSLVSRPKEVPLQIRLLASIICRQWMPALGISSISQADKDKEKQLLKPQILQLLFTEESQPIATQLVLCVAELAAVDWPGVCVCACVSLSLSLCVLMCV